MISALLADDEALARDGIRLELEREPDIFIVDEAVNGPQTVEAIARHQPDLVFLDIQMPGCDGFEVLRRIPAAQMPIVIFVTAYDQYALQAFDARALDYLVKPIRTERFHDAVERARQMLTRTEDQRLFRDRLRTFVESRQQGPSLEGTFYTRFTVREKSQYLNIRAADVDWFEAASNYVALHVNGREYLLRLTLNELEQRLNPRQFARIHRSTIVHLDRVTDVRPTHHGDFVVILSDSTQLRLSRVYRDRVMSPR
jgi:two-component system, LytTR family, response regulator